MLLGPIVGSVLYEFLGFELTFFAIGAVFLVLSPVLFMIIPKSVNVRDSFASRSSAATNQANKYEALAENEDEDSKVIDDTQDINKMEIQESGEMLYQDVEANRKRKKPVQYWDLLRHPLFGVTSLCAFLSYFEY